MTALRNNPPLKHGMRVQSQYSRAIRGGRGTAIQSKRGNNRGFVLTKRPQRCIAVSASEASNDVTAAVESNYELPVAAAELLGFDKGTDRRSSDITRSYKDLVSDGTQAELKDQGYTENILEMRQQLLELVHSAAMEGSRTGDENVPLKIPAAWAPASLLLLVQAAEQPLTALQVGQDVIKDVSDADMRRNVLLCMASAYCSLAVEELEKDDMERVIEGCHQLYEAKQLLNQALKNGGSSNLVGWIDSMMQKHTAYCVLATLEGTLDNPNRQAALDSLRAILDDPSKAGTAIDDVYLSRVLQQLTSREIVRLQRWNRLAARASPPMWLSPSVKYVAGLAQLVVGFTTRKPGLVQIARGMFDACALSTEVERAMAEVLLGDPDTAISTLQAEGPSMPRSAVAVMWVQRPTREEVVDFINRSSGGLDEDDLLPGLVVFTEEWLAQVAFPAFRDTAQDPPQPSLKLYGDTPTVAAYVSRDSRSVMHVIKSTLDDFSRAGMESLWSLREAAQRATSGSAATVDQQMTVAAGSRSDGTGRPPLLLFGLAAVAAVAGLMVWRPWTKFGPNAATTAPSSTAPAVTTATAAPQHATASFTSSQALDIIHRWQRAKSAALGSEWKVERLDAVLHGDALARYVALASKARDGGWYWRTKVHHCKVSNLDTSAASRGLAAAIAEVSESADLVVADGQTVDSFKGEYEVMYEFTEADSGVWKISDVKILNKQPSS